MAPTKADLINQVHSSNPKLSKVQAREALETILKIMRASRVSGEANMSYCQFSGNSMPKLNLPGKGEILELVTL